MSNAIFNKKGAALISALFITALAAMLATALAVRVRLMIHEGSLIVRSDQIYLKLQGVQDWGKWAVKRYVSQWNNANLEPQSLPKPLALSAPDGVVLKGVLMNVQGRFNLNNLVYTSNIPRFEAILEKVASVPVSQAKSIAASVSAWMTTGSDDPYYLSLSSPYRSPRQPMVKLGELRLVKGVTPRIYQAIVNDVTVLPVIKPAPNSSKKITHGTLGPMLTSIDINAATPGALLSANPSLSLAQAKSILDCRKGVVRDLSVFTENCITRAQRPSLNGVSVKSNYFELLASATTGQSHSVLLDSLLFVDSALGKQNQVKVQWQSYY